MALKYISIFLLVIVSSCATAQSSRTERTNNTQSTPPANGKNTQPANNAANSTASTPDQARVLGVLGFDNVGANDAVNAPASVQANQDFQITITTSGNGCVSSGDEGVVLAEAAADVFVYDVTTATRPGVVCTMILKKLDHTVTLRFPKKGQAVIRVWGRRQGGAAPLGDPVVVEKKINVT